MDDEKVEETNEDKPAPRRRKKKKARPASSSREPVASPRRKKRKRPRRPPPEPVSEWTAAHLAMALAVGVGLGAAGGYYAAQPGESSGSATKDTGAEQAPAKNKRAAAPKPPMARKYIPLAKWSPRIGPDHAKVTILEFSDFQ